MCGDDALCSFAALIKTEYLAKSASNSAMERRSGGREFKSTLLHTSVSRSSHIAENRSKSARVRAIREHVWSQRTPPAARFAGIRPNLSAPDFGGSICRRVASALINGDRDPSIPSCMMV